MLYEMQSLQWSLNLSHDTHTFPLDWHASFVQYFNAKLSPQAQLVIPTLRGRLKMLVVKMSAYEPCH